jgi:ankyrin repeat protein
MKTISTLSFICIIIFIAAGCKDYADKGTSEHTPTVQNAADSAVIIDMINGKASLNKSLMTAVDNGQIDTVKVLLDKGANINVVDNNGLTLLMYAAKSGSADMAKLLLSRGAKINVKCKMKGYSAIMFATMFGTGETVQVLLDHGANINERNDDDISLLTVAQNRDDSSVAKLLEKNGAKK